MSAELHAAARLLLLVVAAFRFINHGRCVRVVTGYMIYSTSISQRCDTRARA